MGPSICREHFETVADMASDQSSTVQKEAKELVLGAIYQTNHLQQTLNDALNIRDSDIVSAKAMSADKSNSMLPLYPAPMNKLMGIAGLLSVQLNSLLVSTIFSHRKWFFVSAWFTNMSWNKMMFELFFIYFVLNKFNIFHLFVKD